MSTESQLRELQAERDLWQARAKAMLEIVNAAIAVWESSEVSPIFAGRLATFVNHADVSEPALKKMGAAIERFEQLGHEEKAKAE